MQGWADVGGLPVTALMVALGAGLLVGLERERRKGRGPDREAAGIRTFTLVCVAGALAQLLGQPLLVAVGALGVVVLATLAYRRSAARDPGLTTEIALVAMYLVGVLAVVRPALAAGAGAGMAMLLVSRDRLHRFATRAMNEQELHDALLLAALALVLLPLVPQQPLAWLGGLSPYRMAWVVLLILLLQAAGHLAQRLFGARGGLLLAGFFSGFVSSTATVAAMGHRGRDHPALASAAAAAALMSSVATWVQAALLLLALAPAAARAWAPAALAGASVALAVAAVVGRAPTQGSRTELAPQAGVGVLRLREAVLVGTLLAAATLVVSWANEKLGPTGAWAGAAISGLADAHASTAALGALCAAGQLSPAGVAAAVLAAVASNSVVRTGVAAVSGGRRYAASVGTGLLLSCAAAWAAWMATR